MAVKRQKVVEYTKITDNVDIHKLSIRGQLMALFKRLTYDPSIELDAEEEVAVSELENIANIALFLKTATKPIREGRHKSVIIKVSSKFAQALEDYLESSTMSDYYNIEIRKPNVVYENIHYWIFVRLESR